MHATSERIAKCSSSFFVLFRSQEKKTKKSAQTIFSFIEAENKYKKKFFFSPNSQDIDQELCTRFIFGCHIDHT